MKRALPLVALLIVTTLTVCGLRSRMQYKIARHNWQVQNYIDHAKREAHLAYLGQKHAALALQFASKAIALEPKRSDLYYLRGRIYHLTHYSYEISGSYDPEKELIDYTHAIRLSPDNPKYYLERISCYPPASNSRWSQESEQAMRRDLDSVLAIEPKNSLVYEMRANMVSSTSTQKVRDLTAALHYGNPRDYISLYSQRAEVYEYGMHAWNLAVLDRTKILILIKHRSAEQLQTNLASRAHSYFKLKDYNRALQDANIAINLNPKNDVDSLFYLRGRIQLYKGNYKAALVDCNHESKMSGPFGNLCRVRAKAYRALGNFKAAKADEELGEQLDSRGDDYTASHDDDE